MREAIKMTFVEAQLFGALYAAFYERMQRELTNDELDMLVLCARNVMPGLLERKRNGTFRHCAS